tara:strand:+ start:7023 stop:8804 length:1782 start_codon:yes stop_codon:yes gene_type:complete
MFSSKIFNTIKTNKDIQYGLIALLVVSFILLCLYYNLTSNRVIENFYDDEVKLGELGHSLTGYSIEDGSGNYLVNENSNEPANFKNINLQAQDIDGIKYEITKINLELVTDDDGHNIVRIKGNGPTQTEGNYLIWTGALETGIGTTNYNLNFSSNQENATQFKIELVSGDSYKLSLFKFKKKVDDKIEDSDESDTTQVSLKEAKYILIKDGDDVLKIKEKTITDNPTSLTIKPYKPETVYTDDHTYKLYTKVPDGSSCKEDDNLIISTNKSYQDCALDCNDYPECNFYSYNLNNTSGESTCKLFKKCDQENVRFLDKENGKLKEDMEVVMNRPSVVSEDQQQMLIDALKRQKRLKQLSTSEILMKQNEEKAKKLNALLEELKNTPQYNNKDSISSTNMHLNLHEDILKIINDKDRDRDIHFNLSQEIQNNKIKQLEIELAQLDKAKTSKLDVSGKELKAVKNIKDSSVFNLKGYNDPNDENSKNHLIFGNGGCLAFNKEDSENKYIFTDCDAIKDNQHFKVNYINSLDSHNYHIGKPSKKLFTDKFNVLNYYIVNPKDEPSQCLTMNDGSLTIEPCEMSASQRFSTLYNTVPC